MKRERIRLPRYLRAKRLAGGDLAYFWELPSWARPKKVGGKLVPAERWGRPCPAESKALGTDLAAAIGEAERLNAILDEWRTGVDAKPVEGTVKWLFGWYRGLDRFRRLKFKGRRDYRRAMDQLEDVKLKTRTFGEMRIVDVKAKHADALHAFLAGRHGARTARYAMQVARRAWNEWGRDNPAPNPFAKMGLSTASEKGNRPTSRAEYDAFREAARGAGRQSLATAAAISFELVRRVTDVFGYEFGGEEARGVFVWEDYVPGEAFAMRQGKTGDSQVIPLRGAPDPESEDEEVREKGPLLYPDLEAELARTPRGESDVQVGDRWLTSIVRNEDTGRRYTEDEAGRAFRAVRDKAGLPKEMTLTGFRHGGATELGDAGVEDIRPVSGHRTRAMADVYNKLTEAKARGAGEARRRHVDKARRDPRPS